MKKMLIVDDNPTNRAILSDAFSDEFEIVEAEDGLEGIDCTKRDDYDIILTDIFMPNVDGFEFLAALDLKNNPMPVFVIASDTSHDIIKKAFALGAIDYIARPFDTDIIKARINALLAYIEHVQR